MLSKDYFTDNSPKTQTCFEKKNKHKEIN